MTTYEYIQPNGLIHERDNTDGEDYLLRFLYYNFLKVIKKRRKVKKTRVPASVFLRNSSKLRAIYIKSFAGVKLHQNFANGKYKN